MSEETSEYLSEGVTVHEHTDDAAKLQMLAQLAWIREKVEEGEIVAWACCGLHKDPTHGWVQIAFSSDQARYLHNALLDLHDRFHESVDAAYDAVKEREEKLNAENGTSD